MRTVIIGGAYRAGKSRLANLVFQNVRCTVIHLDAFSNAVRANYPFTEQLCEAELQGYCDTVIVKTIRNMGKEFGYLRVYDSSAISPSLVARRLLAIQPTILFLGYPNTTPDQKLAQVRTAATSDPCCWSHGMSDTELLKAMEKGIEFSQRTEKECRQYKFPFFDVSIDWRNTITEALNYILQHTDSLKNLRS